MAVGKTIIKQDEIQVQKLKVDNITTDVQVNNTLSLNGEKSLSINSLSSGSVKIENHTGGTVSINSQSGGAVNINRMTNRSNITIGSLQDATLQCNSIDASDGTTGEVLIGNINSNSKVWVSDQKTLPSGDVRIACGEHGKIIGGHIQVGAIGGTIKGGKVTVGKMSSGEIIQEGINGGSLTVESISSGSLTVSAMSGGYASIKPKDTLIVNTSGGDGTYKISVERSKFTYNRLYKIWMSNSSGGGGEWGLFAIPNNDTRQTTAYIYSGGDDDGYDGYASLDHYELAIRAKTAGNWGEHSSWDTNFQNCAQIAFVRVRIPRLDWTVDDQTSGKNAEAEFVATKSWKIWDTGIDVTSW